MHRPATAVLALTATGTPANARWSPAATVAAWASAWSASSSTNAFRSGSTASMRRSVASITSVAETSPLRMRTARSVAGRKAGASMAGGWDTTPIVGAHAKRRAA